MTYKFPFNMPLYSMKLESNCNILSKGETNCVHCVENVACQATFSTQCTNLATRLSSITTATTGQTTLGSGTQLDLLMMGIKMPETCLDT